ncbi:hypothetical protein [Brevundimonas sp.]|uniref:hypothetical protein n=1 Tax=Brevundimonas sp. TaxID=1871086 RepID=UPI001A1DF11B|nr:hypothetical protein [Brevundimonas sp.]MBJ7485098.1 hypothetical protein [Brevundimonas sp.]
MRHAIVVLGMHRSGTSSVAGALAHLGVAPPSTLLPSDWDNPRGFWESRRIIEVDDRLLRAGGSYWRDWRRFDADAIAPDAADDLTTDMSRVLQAEFGDASMIVVKEPRMCRLWPQWDPIVRAAGYDPRFVLPIRSPLEVARSLHRRNGIAVAEGLLLWLRHVLDAEQVTRGRPRRILRWDRFMADWRAEVDRIESTLGLRLPDRGSAASAEVDAFLSGDLKTVEASARDLTAGPDTHVWVRAAYEALTVLTDRDDDANAFLILDDLRQRFDQASSLFGRSVGSLLADIETVEQARDLARLDMDRVEQVARRLGRNLVLASERSQALVARLSQADADRLQAAGASAAAEARLRQALDHETGLRRGAEARIEETQAALAASAVAEADARSAADSVRRARDVLVRRLDEAQADAARQAATAADAEVRTARELALAAARIGQAEAELAETRSRLDAETARLQDLRRDLARRPFALAWSAWAPAARRRMVAFARRVGLSRR